MPDGPWQEVNIDFKGPLPSGQYLLVIIYSYFQYPEVEIVSSTAAQKVIPKIDTIFPRHRVPRKAKSDNGPPFDSEDFARYMHVIGVEHSASTPLWPQGNAEVEAFMKPLGRALATAQAEQCSWSQELSRFLLSYRTTPHSSTKFPPAQLLFNRQVRGKLPLLNTKGKAK